ncbi:MAG: NAD-glutamate dehydrogenase [Burkholderiaceae bacterium]|nr:NAD-glutamate dehydrogenase [Burkholderiaceae bacterium]
MDRPTKDLRQQTLELALTAAGAAAERNAALPALIETWLASLEEEDLIGITPDSLAPVLAQGFGDMTAGAPAGCHIATLRCADARGAAATALLIANPDMPFLVDSIVMALRRLRIASRAVLNAVLSVQRAADGKVTEVANAASTAGGKGPLESYVLCLLAEELQASDLSALIDAVRMVAGDAAVVHRDAAAMAEKIAATGKSAAASLPEGDEIAAFLEWAGRGGLECFGYAYYRVDRASNKLVRDIDSRIGVLQDPRHPVYDTCLAGIPEDFATVGDRPHPLSIVKADAQSTLHRDQQLDFIGVSDIGADGKIVGEHCFVGLLSRTAAATPLAQLPFVRGRIKQVLSLAGVRQEGFRAEKFLEILESLPRAEVLEASPEWLAQVCSTVVALYKQSRAKIFARRDIYGRHLNVLVYMPRERYSANLADTLSAGVRNLSGAVDVRVQTLLDDGPLARLYIIAKGARAHLDLDGDIARPLLTTIEGWHNAFDTLVDEANDAALRSGLRKLCAILPPEYVAATSPRAAFGDLSILLDGAAGTQSGRIRSHIEVGWRGMVNIRLLSVNCAPSLSQILPALSNAGVAVDREQTHTIVGVDGARYFITCLTVDAQSAAKLAQPQIGEAARELFDALFNDEVEDGRMNGLVIEVGLRHREVQMLRAYASYWRQTGSRFSLRYIAECLRKQPALARTLVVSFHNRFDPAASAEQHNNAAEALAALKQNLADLNHADTEDILRSLADLILATLRTSYYQNGQAGDTISFKFDCSRLSLLPEPRPYREIFVFSRRFEGVHLRGGPVARGGLRWSDRMEDYRTEVLGLVKAQMVKNAVIVPAGAKGGFVCKMMPKDGTREAIAHEGESVYRLFIAGLLDITDNRSRGAIVAPQNTVCYDDADPYLVVAADKGTATFSDIANGIAVQRGFWLGDAFASGGSNGYDHKKLGITAKGAWEAVKRHFYEIGHDLNTTPITMVGIGDMSGDVFGNGVLLSRQLKLVAAFDHRHIFIDPNPDVVISFAERQRMFALPRSTWDDYNKALISTGGGVWPRTARTIELSDEARAALGIEAKTLTPEQLLHEILLAPVDLLYNGGIGTYIKAAAESHAQVKDRANDALRVDGGALRCKVVAEGGNLGATQAGRIEFALKGGRIFTDAIDNSAGVDCSDHEVNVKIWLDTEVNAGKLAEAERNRVLNDLTGDIEALVLRDNTRQTHLLTREAQAQSDGATQDGYAALIASLESEGVISRELEQLPSDQELARRKAEGRGLTTPELAVVVAHVKNRYKRLLATLPLLENSWAKAVLTPYFPPQLVATRNALEHPLANAILATVLANEAVNRCGPLLIRDLARTHRADECSVILAWAQAWTTLNLAPVFATLDAYALEIPCAESKQIDTRARALQHAVTGGVLAMPPGASNAAGLAELANLFSRADAAQQLAGTKPDGKSASALEQANLSVEAISGMADFLFAALTVDRPGGLSLPAFLQIGMHLRQRAGIEGLERALTQTPATAAQEPLRSRALQALRQAQQRLLIQVLQQMFSATSAASSAAADVAVQAVVARLEAQLGAAVGAEASSLEQVVLDAWVVSEAVAPTAAAA